MRIPHVKPGDMDAVRAEIALLGTPHRARALVAGQTPRLAEAADVPAQASDAKRRTAIA
jgi:hypothetical protein